MIVLIAPAVCPLALIVATVGILVFFAGIAFAIYLVEKTGSLKELRHFVPLAEVLLRFRRKKPSMKTKK